MKKIILCDVISTQFIPNDLRLLNEINEHEGKKALKSCVLKCHVDRCMVKLVYRDKTFL